MARMSNPLDDDRASDVWNNEDVRAETELTTKQIEKVNKLRTLAKVFGSNILSMHLDDFLVLQKSKDRKSMGEFVAAIKSKRDDLMEKGKGFFNNLMG